MGDQLFLDSDDGVALEHVDVDLTRDDDYDGVGFDIPEEEPLGIALATSPIQGFVDLRSIKDKQRSRYDLYHCQFVDTDTPPSPVKKTKRARGFKPRRGRGRSMPSMRRK